MTDLGTSGFPALGTLRARRLLDAVALRIAPGLAAAMVALHHRETAMLGLVAITVTLAVGQAVSRSVTCGYAGSDAGVAWKLCHDLFYLKHRSLLADLLILTETVRTVFTDVQHGLPMPDERFIVGEATT